ncbi:MAG: hypothetical protein OQK32_06170, partial [Gammaproteobacteria bacterium]|nr:hypothetical protein [Gammaproteobacteria bacterium]
NPELKVKIKKISFRTMILELNSTGVLSSRDLDRNKTIDTKSMSNEDIKNSISMGNATLLKGVLVPRVTLEETNDPESIWIENINDKDYNFLVEQITSFSKEVQTDLQGFRKEGDSVSPGQNGSKIQPTA